MSIRFSLQAADQLRNAIRLAGGDEVFAVGSVETNAASSKPPRVVQITVQARGHKQAVPAPRGFGEVERVRAGQVVIHNHPSGVIEPSNADLDLAGRFGADGIGFIIVNNDVTQERWVVEPHHVQETPLSSKDVLDVFAHGLPFAFERNTQPSIGYEIRSGQVDMARTVTSALNREDPNDPAPHTTVLEAGTGTGKSLAYLIPAALWAAKNNAKVIVSTETIPLQGQLAHIDLPMVQSAGIDTRFAVLKGRSNYLCRRKLLSAVEEAASAPSNAHDDSAEPSTHSTLDSLRDWARSAKDGTRAELGFPVDPETWESVASDHDQTLRAQCPHFNECFYYRARRKAAQAEILVVNHHLLLADLLVKRQAPNAESILPKFDRLIIDEAHRLRDAATSFFQTQVTSRALRRAITPLIKNKRRTGSLAQLATRLSAPPTSQSPPPLEPKDTEKALEHLDILQRSLPDLVAALPDMFALIGVDAVSPEHPQLRITPELETQAEWLQQLEPAIQEVRQQLLQASTQLGQLDTILHRAPKSFRAVKPQPFFDLARATRKLEEGANCCGALLAEKDNWVRWIEKARGTADQAALHVAPIEVKEQIRTLVFEGLTRTVATSATLTVGGEFSHFLSQVGLATPESTAPGRHDDTLHQLPAEERPWFPPEEQHAPPITTAVFPSPFDYPKQGLICLPRDIPTPDQPGYAQQVNQLTAEAIRTSGGGAFVLCTSHRATQDIYTYLKANLPSHIPLFRQGDMGRQRLIERFRASLNGVLVGTDSFWQGVSVSGDALRLVIIPRLPFRVPTEPIQQARHDQLIRMGRDPFRASALPEAVLRFRQGCGRLIRTKSDRGALVVLDRRMTNSWYGRLFLTSLPDFQRATGPSQIMMKRLAAFFASQSAVD